MEINNNLILIMKLMIIYKFIILLNKSKIFYVRLTTSYYMNLIYLYEEIFFFKILKIKIVFPITSH